jgi:Predicted transcriptional regulators
MSYIGVNIKRLRKEREMTQENLADALQVSYQAISKWENGISDPDIMLLPHIAEIFGISLDELFQNAYVLHYAGNVCCRLGHYEDAIKYWKHSYENNTELCDNLHAIAELYE